jgi:hypothetical protein
MVSASSEAKQDDSQKEAIRSTSRLVLTPALRVADDTSEEASAEAELPPQEPSDLGMEIDPVSFATEAESVSPEDADIDLDVAPTEDPAEVLAFRTGDPEAEPQGQVPDPAEQDGTEPFAQTMQVEAEESVEQADAAPWHDPEATLYGTMESLDEGVSSDSVATGPEDDGLEPEGSQRVSAVVQKLAELEAKVARSEGQWEPDGNSKDPYAGTNIETLEWQDHDEAEMVRDAAELQDPEASDAGLNSASLAEDAVTDATLDALADSAGDESYLDEDSLRELVADIVRSELQGALGERITRNVRKLVRREIHRALAAQDLI